MAGPKIFILRTSFEVIACPKTANRNPTKESIFSRVYKDFWFRVFGLGFLFVRTKLGCLF